MISNLFHNFRNMLSSAHILAMDTKNLLDVCDSIRARFPNVKYELPEASVMDQQNARLPHQLSNQMQSPSKQHLQQDVYENVSSSERVEEQLYINQNLPSEIGIYDNQASIQEQLKIIEEPTTPTNVDPQFSQKILIN
jgi:Focal adhesion targeting region